MVKKREKARDEMFGLEIPLDASGIEDLEPGQVVKVIAKDRDGQIHATTVKLGKEGQGRATFRFPDHPGPLHIVIGPAEASDEELLGLQTINFNVSTRQWADDQILRLPPVVIHPYYWYWWLRWCRTFTIRGRVICPDGSVVPGAEVCAFDVDWFFGWTSTQQVGCATTDFNGAFEITFRWCCGWWPWWWWRGRVWQLDPTLTTQITNVLSQSPTAQLARLGNQPSLAPFSQILADEDVDFRQPLTAARVNRLPQLRNQLLERLPAAPDLERLRIWPWWPWLPWWDCTPDIIFRVSQDCNGQGGSNVILEEGVGQTRWNISNPLDVTLVVEEACCRPIPCPNPPCEGDECLIVDQVCHFEIDNIGGNLGAPATPEGYAQIGPVPLNSWDYHRPFAGTIPIWKNPVDLTGVDYYEMEYHDGTSWQPLPAGAAVDFERRYFDTAASPPAVSAPFPFTMISGHNVVATRLRYETTSGMTWDFPGADAWWLSTNWNLLLPLDTTKFGDGTYRFRTVGWNVDGSGNLVNPRVLPVCGSQNHDEFVLTFDNRIPPPDPAHPASHPCGPGTVHTCTTEPDTHITAVRINGVAVDPCDTVDATTGTLEIDFLAHDPDGHLAFYLLRSTWGLSQVRNLLNRPGANVTPLSGSPTGWLSGQSRGNYGTALSQGAAAPHWEGGLYRLTVPVSEAFPEPCCYQLELVAHKRTIIGRKTGLVYGCHGAYRNETEYTIGVGVCPPEEEPAPGVLEVRR